MSKYQLNLKSIIESVPAALKAQKLKSLMKLLLTPVGKVHLMFSLFIAEKTYRLEHTGQTYSLEKIIREHCENENCYITDGEYVDEVMVPYDGSESLANYQVDIPYDGGVSPQVNVMYAGFGQVMQNDFLVHLPKELQGGIDEAGLRSKIDEYKIAGKLYKIVYEQIKIAES